MRANADIFITFGQEDPLQVEAVCEHYMSKFPKPAAIKLMNTYAFKDTAPGSEKSYGLLVDVTNRQRLPRYEQRLMQVCFSETPPFILGTPEYWGDEWEERLQFLRDAYHGSEQAGPDGYFEHDNE